MGLHVYQPTLIVISCCTTLSPAGPKCLVVRALMSAHLPGSILILAHAAAIPAHVDPELGDVQGFLEAAGLCILLAVATRIAFGKVKAPALNRAAISRASAFLPAHHCHMHRICAHIGSCTLPPGRLLRLCCRSVSQGSNSPRSLAQVSAVLEAHGCLLCAKKQERALLQI